MTHNPHNAPGQARATDGGTTSFERELDHAFAMPSGEPPSPFLTRVRTRRRHVIATRLGASAAVCAVIIAAAFWARPSGQTPLAPVSPILARGSGTTDLPLVIGSHGQGSDDPERSPAGGDAPRIRMGDGLESEAVRALLAA